MIDKLIEILTAEIGYLEKKSPQDLDSKTANAGRNNYTKYARDLQALVGAPFVNGVPWCVILATWGLVMAVGVEEALRLIGVWTMSCGEVKEAQKAAGRYDKKNPKRGDLVIFEWRNSKGELCRHIGVIYKVDAERIYTIEGNTNASSNTVIANGGGVFKKSYLKSKDKIDGYCHLDYVIVAKPVLKKGAKGAEVRILQTDLNTLGYRDASGKKLEVDGSFGGKTEAAVKAFQKANGLAVDGSYGPRTAAMMQSIMEEEAGKNGKA